MSLLGKETTTLSWPDYPTVWRWHFYAGLFCVPFIVLLAISGGLYLFTPQINA
ncbi:MAG: PepSY domain-containing protein, partial [Nitrospira sp.]|nr:PepSY domain-containing protein [Nitrospira sp.]